VKLTIKTAADLAAEARQAQLDAAAASARAYLADTDWLVVRAAETGKPVPADVAQVRATARETINAARVSSPTFKGQGNG
jgi:hypothetical protein